MKFLTDKDQIRKWVKSNALGMNGQSHLDDDQITIHSDGTVDIDGDIVFGKFEYFKVKFGNVRGCVDLDYNGHTLKSLLGCPQIIHDDFTAAGTFHSSIKNMINGPISVANKYNIEFNRNIASFDGIPSDIKFLDINLSGIESLVDIGDKFPALEAIWIPRKIKTGGLGLVTIPTLKFAYCADNWVDIIQKYLGTDNIIECQSELIEAGYEDYAIL